MCKQNVAINYSAPNRIPEHSSFISEKHYTFHLSVFTNRKLKANSVNKTNILNRMLHFTQVQRGPSAVVDRATTASVVCGSNLTLLHKGCFVWFWGFGQELYSPQMKIIVMQIEACIITLYFAKVVKPRQSVQIQMLNLIWAQVHITHQKLSKYYTISEK